SEISVGGQTISRFDDLDFESIDNVEILRGPAASALYGTQAAAGVIVLTTKRGEPDQKPRWNFFGTLGSLTNKTDFPALYGRLGAGSAPGAPVPCALEVEFQNPAGCVGQNGPGAATPAFGYNIFKADDPFVTGYDEGTGLSVAGGGQQATYYIGGNWTRQQGVYADNFDRRTRATVGLTVHPIPILDIGLTGAYVQRRVGLPSNDNALLGVLTGHMNGNPYDTLPPGFGTLTGTSAQRNELVPSTEAVDRMTGGINGTLRILPWLTARGTAGIDYGTLYNFEFYRPDIFPTILPTGQVLSTSAHTYVYTGAASIAGHYDITRTLNGTTTFGGEWVDQTLRQLQATGTGLVPGTSSLAGATTQITATEVNQDIVNIGGFLLENLAWRNVLFGTISGRLDGNSAFGRDNSQAFYPSGSLSYVISDEAFWPRNPYVTSVRLRAAAGQSGREPTFRLAQGSFAGGAYKAFNAGDSTGLIPNTTGNAHLKPERSTEYEAGVDVGFLRDQFTISATAFDRTERDLIQAIPIDNSTGFGTLTTNLGQIDNRGIELTFDGTIFETRPVSLSLNVAGSILRNKLVSTGGRPATQFGLLINNLDQLVVAGQPLGVYSAVPYTFKDLNHDGVIEPNEITYGTKPVIIGEPGPREEFAFSPTLRIFKFLRINALFDRRDGITQMDAQDAVRCFSPEFVGKECNSTHASLKDQAAAVALNASSYNTGQHGTDFGYILNGSFWKLRELSFILLAPETWASKIGARSASLTIAGRNLATWTPYRGLDPEINGFGNNNIVQATDFTQPPLREWIARIDLSW
ncbi:MAG TPA: TonB-dependent receptor, partial [Gemmatimonadaceae bacterium]|nr:TonB-dependent receptor [Gemmatimonadaceae bacterium]